ncbi:LSU ribosomal protein L29p (L35e) [hydrothermal vent metagenome]|uniref:Large ribosomal subunit protein uL29 n=1 Tax=hydrothermal vent metagenome TaxID=652676 RepID=A0A3B0V978_9ZZZZ
MKIEEMRAATADELKSKVGELGKELFNLRLQHSTGQLENPIKLKMLRKDIARANTIISEKERDS